MRTVTKDGEPWFAVVDVCNALGHTNPSVAIKNMDEDEKMTLNISEGHSGKRGGAQMRSYVSEAGLYKMIFASEKPEAKQFKRWVTHETP